MSKVKTIETTMCADHRVLAVSTGALVGGVLAGSIYYAANQTASLGEVLSVAAIGAAAGAATGAVTEELIFGEDRRLHQAIWLDEVANGVADVRRFAGAAMAEAARERTSQAAQQPAQPSLAAQATQVIQALQRTPVASNSQ